MSIRTVYQMAVWEMKLGVTGGPHSENMKQFNCAMHIQILFSYCSQCGHVSEAPVPLNRTRWPSLVSRTMRVSYKLFVDACCHKRFRSHPMRERQQKDNWRQILIHFMYMYICVQHSAYN